MRIIGEKSNKKKLDKLNREAIAKRLLEIETNNFGEGHTIITNIRQFDNRIIYDCRHVNKKTNTDNMFRDVCFDIKNLFPGTMEYDYWLTNLDKYNKLSIELYDNKYSNPICVLTIDDLLNKSGYVMRKCLKE